MLLLTLFYLLSRTIGSSCKTEFSVILYNITTSDRLILDYKTLCRHYAQKYNFQMKMITFETAENLSEHDVNLVDADDYKSLDPNPFKLTSVERFFSVSLIIPSIKKIDKFLYFSLPFSGKVWILILIAIVYFASALKLAQRKISFGSHLLNSFTLQISKPIDIGRTSDIVRFIYLNIIAFSWILCIIYMTYLGSFLTANVDKTKFTYICTQTRLNYLQIDE